MKFYKSLMIGALLILSNSCDELEDFFDDHKDEKKSVTLDLITDGLTSPVVLTEAPDQTGRLFLVDAPGQVYIIKNGERWPQPFLDISGKVIPRESVFDERGLLGLAFHPHFSSNGRFFVYYSGPLQPNAPAGFDHTNYVAEYHAMPGSHTADPASERILLAMDHPQDNHNAGMIAFGKDGYLYISVGDGGGSHDIDSGHVEDWYPDNAGGNGQDITENLLGSILRIDVNQPEGYGIPVDNPFVGKEGLDEIYAYGLRNPYRFCFDPHNKIILADAGQELYEEINLVEKGGNYGWNVKEGRHCFDAENPTVPPASCPTEDVYGTPLTDPVIEFKNSRTFSDGLGAASVGGYVYHGNRIHWLKGKYIFGVWAKQFVAMDGAIFAADRSGNDWNYTKLSIANRENKELRQFVLGFGQDNDGEVYVLTNEGVPNSGKVYKLDK